MAHLQVGYVLGQLAGIMVGLVMPRSHRFGRAIPSTPIVGNLVGFGLYLPTVGVAIASLGAFADEAGAMLTVTSPRPLCLHGCPGDQPQRRTDDQTERDQGAAGDQQREHDPDRRARHQADPWRRVRCVPHRSHRGSLP